MLWVAVALLGGCVGGPSVLPEARRTVIDRGIVEWPVGLALTTYLPDLTAPTSIAFEPATTEAGAANAGALLVAEGGLDAREPRLYAFRADGSRVNLYPRLTNPLSRLAGRGQRIFGPIGGLATRGDGEVYVSHRDANGRGAISAVDFEGRIRSVVGDLPAGGDFSVTDLAFHPTNGRLYFGLGAATNSGVVGIDNWESGWTRERPEVADVPAVALKLLGSRFDTRNPAGGLFGGDDIAVTAPFQPFGARPQKLRIPAPATGKPSAAIYSISPGGGDLRVEAHGLRHPRGIAFTEFGNLLVSNQGMEMRGTRPVKDDPDVVVRVPPGVGTWFGWPDFSADLQPITTPRFQPPGEMILRTGYPEVLYLIDHAGSGLIPPDRSSLVRGVFPSLSGAAKMTFVGEQPGFEAFKGSLLVALSGDRFPFATSGVRLKGPIGFKIVRLDPDAKQTADFVANTAGKPGSQLRPRSSLALERPIDVKFGPDGALYIVDVGQLEYRNGRPRVKQGSGKILRLAAATTAESRPARE